MMEPSMSRSAAAGAGGEPNPDAEPIEGALQRAGLQVWQQALQGLGVHTSQDLSWVYDEELWSMGMALVETRKLRYYAQEAPHVPLQAATRGQSRRGQRSQPPTAAPPVAPQQMQQQQDLEQLRQGWLEPSTPPAPPQPQRCTRGSPGR